MKLVSQNLLLEIFECGSIIQLSSHIQWIRLPIYQSKWVHLEKSEIQVCDIHIKTIPFQKKKNQENGKYYWASKMSLDLTYLENDMAHERKNISPPVHL